MSWLFYDYETLSAEPITAPVVCYAGAMIDPDRFTSNDPYTLSEIRDTAMFAKFDITTQITEHNKIIQQSCLDWWKKDVDAGTRNRLLTPRADDLPLSMLPGIILENIGTSNLDAVYTRGNTFDPVITEVVCKELGVPEPHAWWLIRDTRSMLDGLLWGSGIDQKFTPKTDLPFSLHDPVDDIALDILRIQVAVRGMS